MALLTTLLRKPSDSAANLAGDAPKHLGWIMLTALGIGATIGAGIFAMPGIIAGEAGPAGILSFLITGLVILVVAVCYDKFAQRIPSGVSAYSYVYHSIGEVVAWIVAFGLFLEYSFGSSAVAIGWAEYLKIATGFSLPGFWSGPSLGEHGEFHFGVNVLAMAVILVVTLILVYGGVSKSAKLNFFLVILKLTLLLTFLAVGIPHINPKNWENFMPFGWEGVLKGAATAVFPYVGFDALFTFARESKSLKDTRLATYWCVGIVAALYITVMAVATGLAPCYIDGKANELFVGTDAAAPLAKLLAAAGEGWTAKFISAGAVLGIFNVLLVLCMGGPRIFRSMAEDGLLPPAFKKANKGNPTLGIILNGVIVALTAGLVPFGKIAHMMVLGTLVAFVFVCIGAWRMKLVNPLLALIGAVSCTILASKLDVLVLQIYAITLPTGLLIYFFYGYKHSKLARADKASIIEEQPSEVAK